MSMVGGMCVSVVGLEWVSVHCGVCIFLQHQRYLS